MSRWIVALVCVATTSVGVASQQSVATVAGQVIAADTNQPLRLALVVVHGAGSRTTRATMSDLEGRFRFEGLPAESYRVGAAKAPYLGDAVAVGGGDVVVTLQRGAVITGRVLDASGQPRRSVPLRVSGDALAVPQVLSADRTGEYRVHSLPAGEYTIEVTAGEHAATRVSVNTGQTVVAPTLASAAPAPGPGPMINGQPFRTDITQGTASIIGQVVDERTRAPIADIGLTVQRTNTLLRTDASGYFRLQNIAAGEYASRVNDPNYTPTSAALVPVADGELASGIVLAAATLGGLSGVVRDAAGDPVVGMRVQAFRPQVTATIELLFPRGADVTDDLGAYAIGGLPPGDYLVCACAGDVPAIDPRLLTALGPTVPSADAVSRMVVETVSVFPPTWYPSAASGLHSPVIPVGYADLRAGLDVSMGTSRPRSVAGRVLHENNAPVGELTVRLVREGEIAGAAAISEITPVTVAPNGEFQFIGVPDGTYSAVAVQTRKQGPNPGAPHGVTTVVVAGQDVTGVTVNLGQGYPVRGVLRFDGPSPPTPAQVARARVSVAPLRMTAAQLSAIGVAGTNSTRVDVAEDGRFTAEVIEPGDYLVMVTVPNTPWRYVTQVNSGDGSPPTERRLTVGAGGAADVSITVAALEMVRLTGTVELDRYDLPSFYRVVVFPFDKARWTDPAAYAGEVVSPFVSNTRTFTAPDLPPGDYLVALVPQSEFTLNAVALERWAQTATPVTLRAGQPTTLTLRKGR